MLCLAIWEGEKNSVLGVFTLGSFLIKVSIKFSIDFCLTIVSSFSELYRNHSVKERFEMSISTISGNANESLEIVSSVLISRTSFSIEYATACSIICLSKVDGADCSF